MAKIINGTTRDFSIARKDVPTGNAFVKFLASKNGKLGNKIYFNTGPRTCAPSTKMDLNVEVNGVTVVNEVTPVYGQIDGRDIIGWNSSIVGTLDGTAIAAYTTKDGASMTTNGDARVLDLGPVGLEVADAAMALAQSLKG